jgi:capsular polysaccharide biosynthesis protein
MQNQINNLKTDSMNLIDIFKIIFQDIKLILIISISFTIISLFFILQVQDVYKSSTQLVISKNIQTNSSNGIASQYSGIASLAGFSISGGADQSDFVQARINSRDFFYKLLDDNQILPYMFAADSFDKENQKLIFNENIYNTKSGEWVTDKPTKEQAYEYFHNNMLWIRKQGDTKYINMTIKHISPLFAERMLSIIVNQINKITREDDFQKSKIALDYYKTTLANTTIKEVRSTISNLIENQIQTQMLSLTKEDYIVEYIDKPFIPEFPDNLSKKLMTLLSFVMGIFFGALFSLTRAFFKSNS